MFNKKKIAFISFSLVTLASFGHAGNNSTAAPQSNIKVDIEGGTHHSYQEAGNSSGFQNEDSITTDRQIQTAIVNLIEGKYRKYNINIKVSQGNVVLKGSIENDSTKQNIENEIRQIPGVKNINNLLDIQKK